MNDELKQLIKDTDPKLLAALITTQEIQSVIDSISEEDTAHISSQDRDWLKIHKQGDKEYTLVIIRAILKEKPKTLIERQVAAMPANSVALYKQMLKDANW